MDKQCFYCIIKEGLYRHPIYFCRGVGLEPELLEYCPIAELGDTLNRYADTYKVYDAVLDGHPSFMAGIRSQIYHDNAAKYGENKLNITYVKKEIE